VLFPFCFYIITALAAIENRLSRKKRYFFHRLRFLDFSYRLHLPFACDALFMHPPHTAFVLPGGGQNRRRTKNCTFSVPARFFLIKLSKDRILHILFQNYA